MNSLTLISGRSNPLLAEKIARRLNISLADVEMAKFSNSESKVIINESVRGKNVFVVQCAAAPVNDSFFELLIAIHACKIASAAKGKSRPLFTFCVVIAVIPCFPYGKQPNNQYDRIHPTMIEDFERNTRELKCLVKDYRMWNAQTGTLISEMITVAGADHIITMDLHDPQFQGFFHIPLDNLPSQPLFVDFIKKDLAKEISLKDAVIVSPDAGGAKRAVLVSNVLRLGFAMIHKNRKNEASQENSPIIPDYRSSVSMILVGSVHDKVALMIDDLADTCSTLIQASKVLRENGATKIYALVTHGIFSGDSLERIQSSCIEAIICTNSIDQTEHMRLCSKIRVIDTSAVFSEVIRRIHYGESISNLFHLVH